MTPFTDEHEMLRRTVRAFVEKEVVPQVAAWEAAGHGAHVSSARAKDIGVAARHDHEVAHGPADAHAGHGAHGGHGHGSWHGPHESPRPMTVPLLALAVGAVVAGFFGIPSALGGSNAIEHFLEPSFTAQSGHGAHARAVTDAVPTTSPATPGLRPITPCT